MQPAVAVEPCPRRLVAGLVDDHDPLAQPADGTAGAVARAVKRNGTLRRAEHVDDPHAESGRRLLHHLGRPLVAECDAQVLSASSARGGVASRYVNSLPV